MIFTMAIAVATAIAVQTMIVVIVVSAVSATIVLVVMAVIMNMNIITLILMILLLLMTLEPITINAYNYAHPPPPSGDESDDSSSPLPPPQQQQQQEAVAASAAAALAAAPSTTTSNIESQINHELQSLPTSVLQLVEWDVTGKNPQQHNEVQSSSYQQEQNYHHLLEDEDKSKLLLMFDQRLQTQIFHEHNPRYQFLRSCIENDFVKDTELRYKMIQATTSSSVEVQQEVTNDDTTTTTLIYSAVNRFVDYMILLNEIFGPYLLERPIQLVDLTIQERQLQRRGLTQLFKFRCHTGRRIVGCFDTHYYPNDITIQSQVRRRSEPVAGT